MNVEELVSLVQTGESETIEFKKSTAALKSAAETLCAFLNGRGGTVLMGVSDEKKIVGQSVSDQTHKEVANILRRFEPAANVETKVIGLNNDKWVIALCAHPDSRAVPYVFDGKAYERNASTTSMMTQTRYQQLLMLKMIQPISWESQPALEISINDLDEKEILQTAKDIVIKKRLENHLSMNDPIEILTRLKLIKQGIVTNAAVVLFAKEISGNYLQCTIRMARFRGAEKGDFIDSKHVMGNAFQLLQEAETFINRNTMIASSFTKGQLVRQDEPEYPFEAIREALINAIVHRDYASPGGAITIIIYDDRLEITSCGVLPYGIMFEDLKKAHVSHPRNPRICNVFFRRGLIESMGIGTQEIIQSCSQSGMKEPEFFEQAGAFTVRLWSKYCINASESELSFRHQKIIKMLTVDKKMSPQQILMHLHEEVTDRTLRNDLKFLKENKWLESEGRGPNTYWYLIRK